MWDVLICDDDSVFLECLKKSVQKIIGGSIGEVRTFENKEQIIFYISEHPNEINIILLDMNLGESSGIEVGKQICEFQPNSQIIFVSGYDGFYLEAYEVEHIYFLKKPLEERKLKKAFDRAFQKLDAIKKSVFIVMNKRGIQKINLNDILYFEKDKRKMHIHTRKECITDYKKFEEIKLQLDFRFVRCHYSYMVNISQVKKLENKKFYFENGSEVPISKKYYSDVRDEFLDYLNTI